MVQMMESLPVGPEYHILQKDLRPTDWIAVNNYADVHEHSEHIETFADTAALCESMDLIVSVDTSVAHLAGALGSRLIVLVPLCGDWRWGVHQTRSDWYPNAMILRQLELGDWTHPFQKLNLITLMKSHVGRLTATNWMAQEMGHPGFNVSLEAAIEWSALKHWPARA